MRQTDTNRPLNKHLKQALAAHQQGKILRAKELYRLVLKTESHNYTALQYLGILYGQTGRFEDALNVFAKACAAHSSDYAMHYNRGKALQELQRYDEAIISYNQALTINPQYADAHNNRGIVLSKLQHYDEAYASFNAALHLVPNFAEAFVNRGKVLLDLQQNSEALFDFDRALTLNDTFAEAYNNRGHALAALWRTDEGLASFDRAIALQPDFADAHHGRGDILVRMERYEDALASFDRCLALDPKQPYAWGKRLNAKLMIGHWENIEHDIETISHLIEQGHAASTPFYLVATSVNARTLKKLAVLCAATLYPETQRALCRESHPSHERIRIGYFSADFRNHATSHLMAELFEKHDRARFELYAFSFGPTIHDAMRHRLVQAFDHFFDVSHQSNDAIALLARQHAIDIAIDLKGATQGCRPGIFALRPAPIQVNYLGFPGTLGAPCIDYIIADSIIIPAHHFDFYSEKVVQLPHSYQPNDTLRPIASITPTRQELGLPESGFVFCCFNKNYKITPDLFTIWMRLLSEIDGSVLWLFEGNDSISRNLRLHAQRHGIAPDRLVFAPRTNLPDHLARQRQADLFLDTFYYNAHTTASDALWAGLPVITCLGETFPSRVAASLLHAIGIPELVTQSHNEYEALAKKLATHPLALNAIKEKIAAHRQTFPLFDIALFARHIEAAYTAMWQRHQQGLAPDHLTVSA